MPDFQNNNEGRTNIISNACKVSFYCYYDDNCTKHYQMLKLSEIPTWIAAYEFTHPGVKEITAMIKKSNL